MKNVLSIDFESWVHFHADVLGDRDHEARADLDAGYVDRAADVTLDLLVRHHQKATFFVVGEIYDWNPEVVRRIVKEGHEIAYHTHTHRLLERHGVLDEELKRSAAFLQEFRPAGFRAPRIRIGLDSYPVLAENGFRYSSSTYGVERGEKIAGVSEHPVSSLPFRHSLAGKPPIPLTMGLLAREIPFGSGLSIGILRSRTSWFVERLNRSGRRAVVFVHPWQYVKVPEIASGRFYRAVLGRSLGAAAYCFDISKPLPRVLERHAFASFREVDDEGIS